jgi:hypothetical protein
MRKRPSASMAKRTYRNRRSALCLGRAGRPRPRPCLGLVGAVAITAALVVAGRSRPAAMVLLILGALPLAIHSWFSIATAVVAVLCLFFGWPRHPARRDVQTTIPGPTDVK